MVESRESKVEGRAKGKPRFRFEKLDVWQEARGFKQSVYRASRLFPKEELFALTAQLRRPVVSISANIAEGAGRNSDRDFAHFLEIAYGSLMETASLLFLALDEDFISLEDCDRLLDSADQLSRKLAALNRSLNVDKVKTPFVRQPSGSRPSTFDPRPSS